MEAPMSTDQTAMLTAQQMNELLREGTPVLNGRGAETIRVALGTYDLDHADAEHMKLAGQLHKGEIIKLTVLARVTGQDWKDGTEKLGVTFNTSVLDITAPTEVDVDA